MIYHNLVRSGCYLRRVYLFCPSTLMVSCKHKCTIIIKCQCCKDMIWFPVQPLSIYGVYARYVRFETRKSALMT